MSVYSHVRWTGASLAVKAATGFILLLSASRILEPEHFTSLILLIAVTNILTGVIDFGLSAAIIHFQEITNEEYTKLFLINILFGLSLCILIWCFTIILSYYGLIDYEIKSINTIIVGIFLMNLSSQLKARSEKDLKFATLAKIEICGNIILCSIGVVLIFLKFGIISFAIGFLGYSFTMSAGIWLYLSHDWRPSKNYSQASVKRYIYYGIAIVTNNFISLVNSQVETFVGAAIIGRAGFAGFVLNRDFVLRIINVINPIVTRVSFPILARNQENQSILENQYFKIVRLTLSVTSPVYFFIFFNSSSVIGFFFGERWIHASDLLSLLCIWALCRAALNPVGSVLQATGKMNLSLAWNTINLLLLLIGSTISAWFSVQSLAIFSTLYVFLLIFPMWKFLLTRCLNIKFKTFIEAMYPPVLCSIIAAIVTEILITTSNVSFVFLTMELLTFLSVYFLISLSFNKMFMNSVFVMIKKV